MEILLTKISRRGWIAAAMVAAAFGLALCFWNYYPAGYFHDDAIYWLLSQSLRAGHYRLMSDPAQPVFVNYMPGYPLLLAAVGWIDGFAIAKAVSLLLTAASGVLAWILFRRWESRWPALLALAWFIFQPLLIRSSSAVLSEPLFLLLTLLCFYLYETTEAAPRGLGWDIFLALVAGYACLVRPAGFLLGGALFLDSIFRKEFRRAGILAAGLVIFQGGFSLISAQLGHGASSFFGQWKLALSGAPPRTFFHIIRSNLAYYAEYGAFMILFPLGKLVRPLEAIPWLSGFFKAALWAVVLLGAVKFFRTRYRAWIVFFVLQAALLAFWLRPDPRYIQPLIFPGLLFFLRGISNLAPNNARGVKVFSIIGIALCLASDARGLLDISRGNKPRLPEEALTWIKTNLPPDAVVASETSSTVYLQTGRRGTNFLRTYDSELFLRHWMDRGVSYVLVEQESSVPASQPDANDWSSIARLMLTQPGRYEKIRSFDQDKLDFYAVRQDSVTFFRAFQSYIDGLSTLEIKNWAGAKENFQAAVKEAPGMTEAYDRLAAIAARSHDDSAAQERLKEGLARWPSSPLLHYHSYLMRRRLNDPNAGQELDQARALAHRYGYWPLLWQMDRAGR